MAGQPHRSEDDAPLAATGKAAERKVSVPVRLTPDQHEVLRRIAFDRRVSINSLVLEGLAEVMRRHGK